uniref:Uncharacterized protein n=1 Tax=Helianthus annuus TaxID=4232 RepID=A0A251RUY2_HELAN
MLASKHVGFLRRGSESVRRDEDGGSILGDASDGNSEEARFRGFGLEENQTHHHPQTKRQEAYPTRLAE